MKKHHTSIFFHYYNDLMALENAVDLVNRIKEITVESKINPQDKRRIQLDIAPIQDDLVRLQSYLTNAMLKFQGLGTIKTA
jgi:hypothetical protein